MLAKVDVVWPAERWQDAHLTNEADSLARADPVAFFARCGDHYIAVGQRVARLAFLLEYEAVSASELREVQIAAQASVFTGRARVEMSERLEQLSSLQSWTVSSLDDAGTSTHSISTVADLRTLVDRFVENVNEGSPDRWPIRLGGAARYSRALTSSNADIAFVLAEWDEFDRLQTNLADMRDLYAAIESVLRSPDDYGNFDDGALARARTHLAEEIAEMQDLWNACSRSLPTPCHLAGVRSLPDVDLPDYYGPIGLVWDVHRGTNRGWIRSDWQRVADGSNRFTMVEEWFKPATWTVTVTIPRRGEIRAQIARHDGESCTMNGRFVEQEGVYRGDYRCTNFGSDRRFRVTRIQ